jgi:hypothetical protein
MGIPLWFSILWVAWMIAWFGLLIGYMVIYIKAQRE